MKKSFYMLFLIIAPLLAAGSFADGTRVADEDLIVGNWMTGKKTSVVKIYKGSGSDGEDSNKYYGKIVWLKEPYQKDDDGNLMKDANGGNIPRKDVENPEESLRDRNLKGLVILKHVEFIEIDGKVVEYGGDDATIYNARNGSDYGFEAEINTKKPDEMEGRGFIGVSMFGITETWVRMNKK